MNPSETLSEDFVHPGEDFVKIVFHLERDEDGYPPDEWESMWATKTEEGYILENIPFFAMSVSYLDLVAADMTDGELRFREVIRYSDHSTVRLLIFDVNMVPAIREHIRELGCDSEDSGIPGLIAVDIPPTVDIPAVKSYLKQGFDNEIFSYQESSIIW